MSGIVRDAFAFAEDIQVRIVPLNNVIVQTQVRRHFDEDKMRGLINSIRTQGIMQPLGVKETGGGKYLLIMGERRYRAARELGLSEIPVRILRPGESAERTMQIAENLQRENLNDIERTEGLLELFAERWQMNQEQARKHLRRVRKNPAEHTEEAEKIKAFFAEFNVHWNSFVAVELGNLTLPEALKELCRNEGLEITKAREFAKVSDETLQIAMARRALAENWSLRQVKDEVAPHLPARRGRPAKQTTPGQLRESWREDISRLPEARRKAALKIVAQLVDIIYPGQSDGSAARGHLPRDIEDLNLDAD